MNDTSSPQPSIVETLAAAARTAAEGKSALTFAQAHTWLAAVRKIAPAAQLVLGAVVADEAGAPGAGPRNGQWLTTSTTNDPQKILTIAAELLRDARAIIQAKGCRCEACSTNIAALDRMLSMVPRE